MSNSLAGICSFYAVSPVHAGSGASTSAVDLPIQRERHTHWPHIQASAVKGGMRAHYRMRRGTTDDLINIIFGSDEQDGWNGSQEALKGAVSVSDAKLLAFPVRSDIAPFVWVTSPTVLKRFITDLHYVQQISSVEDVPEVSDHDALVLSGKVKGQVILEDVVVTVSGESELEVLTRHYPFLERLLCVSDQVFSYLVDTSTEIQTHIKIDSETGTAASGALRYEELLPADSLLYSVVLFGNSAYSTDEKAKAETIKNELTQQLQEYMQLGGDETLGKGICRITWIGG
ncbi:MAG TPA: type III-B CRISPR module RAMP protein Cmr4 [Sediminispirochaeta sp.]|mgnify:CR=1 FL=1|nr:type III-B CRISPR module RAMP protein Cmr4 [Sediminispirochaeta sp.]